MTLMVCSLQIALYIFLESVTSDAASLHQLYIYFLIAAAFVLLCVVGAITYFLIKYRARNEQEEPPQIHGDKKVEISLTLLATALVGFFFYLTVSTMMKVNKPVNGQKPDLVITGHQWWWEAQYPKAGTVTANEIHVPVGKRILLQFKSADVIHDWWVPDLGRKMDIIPGKINHLWLKINKPGLYLGACSEYCGIQHAWMRIRVIAQPQDEFKQWERKHAKPALQISGKDSLAALGKKLFMQKTCSNCHAIKGTRAAGQIGPDLTHLASRKTLLTGMIKNTPQNLHKWIHDPQKIKEGAHMPRFILEKKQVDALVSYLETLK